MDPRCDLTDSDRSARQQEAHHREMTGNEGVRGGLGWKTSSERLLFTICVFVPRLHDLTSSVMNCSYILRFKRF